MEQLGDNFVVACAPSHSSCVAGRYATSGYPLERTPRAHDTRDKRGPPRQLWLCPCTISTPSYSTACPAVKTASKRRATVATKACPGPIRVLPTHTHPLLHQMLASQPAGEILPPRDRPVDYLHPEEATAVPVAVHAAASAATAAPAGDSLSMRAYLVRPEATVDVMTGESMDESKESGEEDKGRVRAWSLEGKNRTSRGSLLA